jgi:uncharacterized protein
MSMSDSVQVIDAASVAPVPWRNGAGMTRELVVRPGGEWWLRISVATVAHDGPFSVFSGVDRRFAVLEGDGVELHAGGCAPLRVTACDEHMVAFPGDVETHCVLLGSPTTDLNVMVKRDAVSLAVTPLRACLALQTRSRWLGCYVTSATRIEFDGSPPRTLPRGSLAWVDNPKRSRIAAALPDGAPRGWWIEIDSPPA